MSSSQLYIKKLSSLLSNVDNNEMDHCISLVRAAWERKAQIITLGNGGSAMTALHFITDWSKMIFLKTGKPFYGRTLVDNIGLITAYSNDISYQDVFSEQLRNILKVGDLVIAISGSGNSENVIRAVDYANDFGVETIGLSGFDGGRLRKMAKHNLWVNSNDMQLVEDVHAMFGHIVMQDICDCLNE